MAVGNTFGATALSSYGGFWIAFGIVLTPGGFQIVSALEAGGGAKTFYDSFGYFLMVSFESLSDALCHSNVFFLGLVDLYYHPLDCHPPLYRRLFLALLHARHGIFASWNRLPSTWRGRRSKPACHQGGWLFRSFGRLLGMV